MLKQHIPLVSIRKLLESVGWEHRTNELFQKSSGCRDCSNSGFRGRVGIYEVVVMDSELKRLVQDGANESHIRMYLAETGWLSLRDKALAIVERGESTLEEVLRVTRSETVAAGDPSGSGLEQPS